MELVCQYEVIFFNFSLTSSHLHPLQVGNCDSNSRLVLDEDDNGKFRLERVNAMLLSLKLAHPQKVLLAQFSLYVHNGGLKPHSFYFILKLA